MASSTGGINSEAKWFGSISEKASRSESKSVVTISVSRRAIFSVRKGTTPCQPNSPYGASSNRCKSSPRYSRGTNIIFTPIQFVTKPTPAATVGMRAYAPGLAATSWPIRVRRPAGCCAGALKDARCRQPAAWHRAPRCRIESDNIVRRNDGVDGAPTGERLTRFGGAFRGTPNELRHSRDTLETGKMTPGVPGLVLPVVSSCA